MALLEYFDDVQTIEIEYDSNTFLSITSAPIRSFLSALGELNREADLSTFDVILQPDGTYTYGFVGANGRVWNQVLSPGLHNMFMSFDVPDFWELQEFEPNRDVRKQVIRLVTNHNLIKINVNFT